MGNFAPFFFESFKLKPMFTTTKINVHNQQTKLSSMKEFNILEHTSIWFDASKHTPLDVFGLSKRSLNDDLEDYEYIPVYVLLSSDGVAEANYFYESNKYLVYMPCGFGKQEHMELDPSEIVAFCFYGENAPTIEDIL